MAENLVQFDYSAPSKFVSSLNDQILQIEFREVQEPSSPDLNPVVNL